MLQSRSCDHVWFYRHVASSEVVRNFENANKENSGRQAVVDRKEVAGSRLTEESCENVESRLEGTRPVVAVVMVVARLTSPDKMAER